MFEKYVKVDNNVMFTCLYKMDSIDTLKGDCIYDIWQFWQPWYWFDTQQKQTCKTNIIGARFYCWTKRMVLKFYFQKLKIHNINEHDKNI